MKISEEILKLKDGESYTVPESDYGKAIIIAREKYYEIYSIPLYGGEPVLEFTNGKGYEELIEKDINSWT